MAKAKEIHWMDELTQIEGISLHTNHRLCQHTPLRLGGMVEAWVRCNTIDALRLAMPIVRKQPWKIHWPFEDWLVRDGVWNGVLLRLEGDFEKVQVIENGIQLGSSALWSTLKGLENIPEELCEWPGTVGSALLSDKAAQLFAGFELEVEWLHGRHKHRRYFDQQMPFTMPQSAIPLCIRIFNIRKARKLKPLPNGQVFQLEKKTAGQSVPSLLQDLDLHAVRLRTWKISSNEPHRIVHLGHADFEDLQLLQKALNQKLQPARNVKLSFRLPVFGSKPE